MLNSCYSLCRSPTYLLDTKSIKFRQAKLNVTLYEQQRPKSVQCQRANQSEGNQTLYRLESGDKIRTTSNI